MKIIRSIETEANWEKIRESMKNGEFNTGDRLDIFGTQWRVLDVKPGKILIQKFTNVKAHVFDEEGSNDYKESDIRSFLEFEFLKEVPEELISMTGADGFFLLSEEEVKEYMPNPADRIAIDENGYGTWWWTRSPSVGNGCYVRCVYPTGGVYGGYAYGSHGVAPACWLQSDHHE